MRIQLTDAHRAKIAEAVEDFRAGRIKTERMSGRDPTAQLRYAVEWRQRCLIGWRSSPPRHRGYTLYPDVAHDLLLELRCYRRVMRLLGIRKAAATTPQQRAKSSASKP